MRKEKCLRHVDVAGFADLWYAAKTEMGTDIPAKADIPVRELARFMPYMSLTDGEVEPKYLLCGTIMAEEFGRDLMGLSVFDFMTDEARDQFAGSVLEFYGTHEENTPFARWGIGAGRTGTQRHVEYESLTLPYWEPSRVRIHHMTYARVLVKLDYGEGMAMRYPDVDFENFNAALDRPEWLYLRD